MLADFLLTPDVFLDCAVNESSEMIRELHACLFPIAAAPVALICKLGGDEWTHAVSRKIMCIKNASQRQRAMDLLTRILDQLSVARPALKRDGSEESHWILAGVNSSSQVPLSGIVLSEKATPPDDLGVQLKQFVQADFWDAYSNPRLVDREIAKQTKELRAICTYSDWLVIRFPQIRGGSDDEIVTVKQAIQLATQLPHGFSKSDVDLQFCEQSKFPKERLISNVSSELRSFVNQGTQITLTIWPEGHFISREIIGGEYASLSKNTRIKNTRWWITMGHVAVGSRRAANTGDAANTWSLFSKKKAEQRIEELAKQSPVLKHTVV